MSPSGRHLGLYKSLLANPICSDMCKMFDVTTQCGRINSSEMVQSKQRSPGKGSRQTKLKSIKNYSLAVRSRLQPVLEPLMGLSAGETW